jgi:hypothetical protein
MQILKYLILSADIINTTAVLGYGDYEYKLDDGVYQDPVFLM